MIVPFIEDMIDKQYSNLVLGTIRTLAVIHLMIKFTTHTDITLENLDKQIRRFNELHAVCLSAHIFIKHFGNLFSVLSDLLKHLESTLVTQNSTHFLTLSISFVDTVPQTITTLASAKPCILKARRTTAVQTDSRTTRSR